MECSAKFRLNIDQTFCELVRLIKLIFFILFGYTDIIKLLYGKYNLQILESFKQQNNYNLTLMKLIMEAPFKIKKIIRKNEKIVEYNKE